jgi:restriction system protein
MNLKMNKNSLFAILLRSPWWVSSGVALVVVVVAWAALPPQYKLFGMLISGPFWAVSAMSGWRHFRAPNPEYIEHRLQIFRSMSWQDFSASVQQALLRDGFVVTRLDSSEADFAIDTGERKGLVSCKRWKVPNNGVEPLRDLYQAMQNSDGQECIYITTGNFTQNAMQFAVEKKIRLLHGATLVQFLREIKTPVEQKNK